MSASHSKPRRLATAVLTAAVNNDWAKSQRAFTRLAAECDESGLGEALLSLCDTTIAHMHGGTWDFQPTRIVPMAVETGALGGVTDPAKQWAFDLIQARGSGNLDEFRRLLAVHSAVEDGFERGRYASALVEIAATTIRTMPSGIAQLGCPAAGGAA